MSSEKAVLLGQTLSKPGLSYIIKLALKYHRVSFKVRRDETWQ